jgi:hypothetical protein
MSAETHRFYLTGDLAARYCDYAQRVQVLETPLTLCAPPGHEVERLNFKQSWRAEILAVGVPREDDPGILELTVSLVDCHGRQPPLPLATGGCMRNYLDEAGMRYLAARMLRVPPGCLSSKPNEFSPVELDEHERSYLAELQARAIYGPRVYGPE